MGVKTYLEATMEAGEICLLDWGVVGVFSARAPDKEGPNEDAAAIIPIGRKGVVLAVADGLGGHRGGAKAAALAVTKLQKALETVDLEAKTWRPYVLNGFEAANKAVRNLGTGAATTLSVVGVMGDLIRNYHVGDSHIVAVGQRGKVRSQSISHSPVGYAVEAGVLNEKEALAHDDLHIVSNVIGASDLHIEVGMPRRLRSRDTVLVCSDGLADNFTNDELIERIRKGKLECIMSDLVAEAQQRMQAPKNGKPSKPDDITFILYRLNA